MAFYTKEQLMDLIYWREPKKTGPVLAVLLVILLSLANMSLISVVSYASLVALAVSISFRLYKNVLQTVQKTQEGHPYKDYLEKDVSVPTDKVHEMADKFTTCLNSSLLELRRLFLIEDLVDSIKFGLLLWTFTYVGAWFNGLTLIILGVVGTFTLPKVYDTHHEKIDHHMSVAKAKVHEIWEKIHAKLPMGKKSKSQ